MGRANTRVAVCQLEGRNLDAAIDALEACDRLVAEAARQGADLAVLPEGSYPAYVLGSVEAARQALAAGPDPLAAGAALAARHEVTLVAGLVLDTPGGLLNAAVTFAPDGTVLSSVAKRFLWHFDARWFVAGEESPVADTPAGRVGALVCADARLPEIARTMAVAGAALVCDPTAWVTSTPGSPSNIQPEFLIPARCIENGFVIACASKAGFEGDGVAYTGRSMVVGPDGEVLVEAPSRGDHVVVADVDLAGLPRPPVARRAELFADLATAGQRATSGRGRVRLAAVTTTAGLEDAWVDTLASQGVALVAVPGDADAGAVAAQGAVWAATGDAGTARLVAPDGSATVFPAHADPAVTALTPPVETPAGRVAVIPGDDALVPEVARIAMLRGADVLVCTGSDVPLAVLRTRAAENRVFVVAPGPRAVVIAPSGTVVADAPADRPFIASADALLDEAASKEMAPGTDVLTGRQPATYASLLARSTL